LEVVRRNKNMALGATNDAVLTPRPSIILCAYQQGLPQTVATIVQFQKQRACFSMVRVFMMSEFKHELT